MLWAAWLSGAFAQEADSALPGRMVTSQALESKIAEAQAATDMTEEAKTRLVERCRKASRNLHAARDNAASAATFRRMAEGAPAPKGLLSELLDAGKPGGFVDGLDYEIDYGRTGHCSPRPPTRRCA
jgi:potassium efflux system protein